MEMRSRVVKTRRFVVKEVITAVKRGKTLENVTQNTCKMSHREENDVKGGDNVTQKGIKTIAASSKRAGNASISH